MIEYRIRYTPEAIRDMDAVWDGVYEASKEPDAAPLSGVPLLYKGLFTGFYVVHFKKYKAFYRVNDSYIEVIRIIMEKMDYMKILFEESNAD